MQSARLTLVFLLVFSVSPLHASDERVRVAGIVPFPDADRAPFDRRPFTELQRPDWVNDRAWNELVFGAHDYPWVGDHVNRRTRTLAAGQVSDLVVYFVNDTDGPTFESAAARRAWNVAFFNLVYAMTGTIWIGEITDGPDRQLTDGRIHGRIGQAGEFTAAAGTGRAIAFARTWRYQFPDGTYARWAYSEIVINPQHWPRLLEDYGYVVAHEIAHVLGFSHVSDRNNLMYPNYSGVPLDRDTLAHMTLASGIGPGVLYPGVGDATPVPALPWVGVVLLALLLLVSGRRVLTATEAFPVPHDRPR